MDETRVLSQYPRDQVVWATDGGVSCWAAAVRLELALPQHFACARLRKYGTAIAGQPSGDRRSSKADIHAEYLAALLPGNGDMTLAKILSSRAAHGVHIGIEILWLFFDRRGITRKRRQGARSGKTDPTSCAKAG